MFQTKKEYVLLVFDNFIYFIWLAIGFYFISEGEVVQRYLVGRTDFYQFNEAMTEFPTIMTFIQFAPTNSRMGKDFNVSLSLMDDMLGTPTVLTVGKNHIQGTDIEIDFQHFHPWSKIILLSPEEAWWKENISTQKFLKVVYSFANASLWSKARMAIKLSTENNTLWCSGHHDGDVKTVFANVGESVKLLLQPKKFIYLKDKYLCRQKPFSEELNDYFNTKDPGKLCKFPSMFGICPAMNESCHSGIVDDLFSIDFLHQLNPYVIFVTKN